MRDRDHPSLPNETLLETADQLFRGLDAREVADAQEPAGQSHQTSACAVLLAGGRGTRLQTVCADLPKPFISCAGKPFIEWVFAWLENQGVKCFVVSLGHLSQLGEEILRRRPADGCRIETVREQQPLGTGGALRFALSTITPPHVVICANADSLVLADLAPAWYALGRPEVDGVLVGVEMDDASRYGTLRLDEDGNLTAFQEKQPGRGVINAGVYFFRRSCLEGWSPQTPLSLEHDVFPALLEQGRRFWVHRVTAPFLDIGTPESLAQAERFVRKHLLHEQQP